MRMTNRQVRNLRIEYQKGGRGRVITRHLGKEAIEVIRFGLDQLTP